MDNKELRSPSYKMTVDDFFHKRHPFGYKRAILCNESWQYDIVSKVFTRMGKIKHNGFKYRYNDGTKNSPDDDWSPWFQSYNRSAGYAGAGGHCYLDNRGEWGILSDYEYPSGALIREWIVRNGKYQDSRLMDYYTAPRLEAYSHHIDKHPKEMGTSYLDWDIIRALIQDGFWVSTDRFDFLEIDFTKYLTPDEMDFIKSKCGVDVRSAAKDDTPIGLFNPSKYIGTEEEEREKWHLWRKINHPEKKVDGEIDETTIKKFFDLGINGDIRIQCDEPWQVEILRTVFKRMGRYEYGANVFQFQYATKFPCHIGPGNYSYKTTVHFDDVDLTEYLTLDEVKKLVYKQVDEPIARINACRNPQNSISFYDFLHNGRMAVDCNRGYSEEVITAFSNLLWNAQPYERQKLGRKKIIGPPYGYFTNEYYNYARKEDCERWGYKIIKLEDLVLPPDALAPRELKALANCIERRQGRYYCSPFDKRERVGGD